MAILTVVLVLLSSLGLAMAWASRGALVAQQFANNHYQAAQAHEAAVAALEEAITWTATMASKQAYPAMGAQPATCTTVNPFVGSCWQNETLAAPFASTDLDQPPYNAAGFQRLKTDRTNTIDYSAASSGAGSYTTTVRIRHAPDLSAVNYLELTAQAVSNDSPEVTAMAHQIVYFPFMPVSGNAPVRVPVLVNGCLSLNLFNSTNICPQKNDGKGNCTSSNPNGSTVAIGNVNSCNLILDLLQSLLGLVGALTSSTNLHGGSYQMGMGSGTVFNTMLAGLSMAQIQQASEMQAAAGLTESAQSPRRTIWYFSVNYDGQTHGTLASPALVVVNQTSSFISLSPGSNYTVNGALYLGNPSSPSSLLNINFGGSVNVNGVFGVEGTPSTFGSSTNVVYNDSFYTSMNITAQAPAAGSSTARVPGSWRDW